jgi:hypothetical protein
MLAAMRRAVVKIAERHQGGSPRRCLFDRALR